jgi:protein-disulfide isomerase
MKPFLLFLSGSLLGVGITVATMYIREPLSKKLAAIITHQPKAEATAVTLPLRAREAAMGSDSAPVTLVEFSDFQCQYCAVFRTKVFPRIKAKFIDAGKLRFIHRHLPLSFHKNAKSAAQATVCAGDQGQYWALSDLIFSRASCLDCQGVMELSKALDLDRKRFEACMSSNAHVAEIEEDMESASQLQIDGTPSFVLGRTKAHSVDGVVLRGIMPFAEFEAQINAALNLTLPVSTR